MEPGTERMVYVSVLTITKVRGEKVMTTEEALIWCKKHNVKVKSATFDDSTIWLARMHFNGETITGIFRDYPGATTRLRCKLQEKTRSCEVA